VRLSYRPLHHRLTPPLPARPVTVKGGRPVTWIGGGGQDPAKLSRMSVPDLRDLFKELFGQPTASNNSAWLRRKLAEPAAEDEGGARRAPQPRSRDVAASIWSRGEGEGEDGSRPRPGLLMARCARPDPCLLEAQMFIARRPARDTQPPPPPPPPPLPKPLDGVFSGWGVKRRRMARQGRGVTPLTAELGEVPTTETLPAPLKEGESHPGAAQPAVALQSGAEAAQPCA